MLQTLNQEHLKSHPEESELLGRINAYELAYRMQTTATEVVDINHENDYEYVGTYGSSNAMMVLNRKTGIMLTRFVSDMPNDNNTFHEINWANQSEQWVAK